MNLLRSYVRRLLAEESLGIHGAGMTEDELLSRLGFGGIEIEKAGPVTDDEADRIAKKIAADRPERVYAYSRGAAAFNKAMLDDDMPSAVPPVTYVAPAALRGWTDAAVPDLPAGSVTVIGDRDAAVSIKQACDVAKQANTPLFVHPEKSHAGVLYTKGSTDGAYEIDLDACLTDDELPSWDDGAVAGDDELAVQMSRVPELRRESILRRWVRGLLLEQAAGEAKKIADMVQASAPRRAGDPEWDTGESRLAAPLTPVNVALQDQAIELMLAVEVPPLAVLDALWERWRAEQDRWRDYRLAAAAKWGIQPGQVFPLADPTTADAANDWMQSYYTGLVENNRLVKAIAKFVGLDPGGEPYGGPAGGRGFGADRRPWTKEEALASLQDRLGDRR